MYLIGVRHVKKISIFKSRSRAILEPGSAIFLAFSLRDPLIFSMYSSDQLVGTSY